MNATLTDVAFDAFITNSALVWHSGLISDHVLAGRLAALEDLCDQDEEKVWVINGYIEAFLAPFWAPFINRTAWPNEPTSDGKSPSQVLLLTLNEVGELPSALQPKSRVTSNGIRRQLGAPEEPAICHLVVGGLTSDRAPWRGGDS